MRNLLLSSALSSISLISLANAEPKPTTSACLGDIHALRCPAGAQRSGTECRTSEAHGGRAPGEHWSGSQRQGPSVFVRDNGSVSFAANYKDHKKHGRVFNFDADGKLSSWADMADDDFHGLSVDCRPDGTASGVAYFEHGKVVGVSRAWRADGTLSYALDHDAAGHTQAVTPTPAQERRPDELCRPSRCDLDAKPDLSGIPRK